MSWVTIIWSMIASACLTLAVIYFLVWCTNRTAWAHLLFSVTAAATAGVSGCELWLMRAATPGGVAATIRWGHVPVFVWLVAITWFVWHYFGTGRLWLAWTGCGLRALALLLNFTVGQNLNLREVTALRHVQFLGEPVTIFEGVVNPWALVGHLGALVILAFVADASVTAWRRHRRKALTVGGTVEFFILFALSQAVLVFWADVQMPIVLSPFYLGVVSAMGYELSRDVLRSSQLVGELRVSEAGLRESEARMSLAVDAAGFGILIQDLTRNEIWASEKWRELFGLPSELLDIETILERVHPDDREGLRQVHANAIAGAGGGRYQTEFRLLVTNGATRWISSRGRVEHDAAGQPVLVRGACREDTARKRAELALRTLSGRLLSAQEDERRRIARELHDNLSQRLALLSIEIEQVAGQADRSLLARSIRVLGERTADISTEIHNMSHRLHSSKLEALGLAAAVRGHCREVLAQGLRVEFWEVDVPVSLSRDVQLCLFRVVQEGLNNVVKHSGAREAQVTLNGTRDALMLSIADVGRGFDETEAADRDGLGLASMRERLRLIDGELTVTSRSGHGTTIEARAPLISPRGQPAASGQAAHVAHDAGTLSV
jgi:PAS domain S-box-containing protein